MLPQDDIPPDIVFEKTDQRSLRRVFFIAALVLLLVLVCGLWPIMAGAEKRPQPAPPRVCVANVVAQDQGMYRADIDGAPALVFARSARRPVLRVGCYQAGAFKAEWRVQR